MNETLQPPSEEHEKVGMREGMFELHDTVESALGTRFKGHLLGADVTLNGKDIADIKGQASGRESFYIIAREEDGSKTAYQVFKKFHKSRSIQVNDLDELGRGWGHIGKRNLGYKEAGLPVNNLFDTDKIEHVIGVYLPEREKPYKMPKAGE